VIDRAHHVREERLFDCYLAERGEETIDPRTAEHLADCDACALRYADLREFMERLRTDADAETDVRFTPDRLRAQQLHIARRIEQLGRAARVIRFPRRFAGRHVEVRSGRTAPRWVAAAAAAGLFFGAALGASFEWDRHLRAQRQLTAARRQFNPAHASRLAPLGPRSGGPGQVADDDAFLSELDVALERPQTRELQPFDAFTPHVREITYRR
jgi:anti-sigma factor RsiW